MPLPQTRDAIQAFALDGAVDYLPLDRNKTRVTAELTLASGDPDRGASSTTYNGNAPGTTDLAFNAFGLLNTGLAFSDQVSNLLVLRLGASTFPLPGSAAFSRMQLGTDLFFIAKYRASPRQRGDGRPQFPRHRAGLLPQLAGRQRRHRRRPLRDFPAQLPGLPGPRRGPTTLLHFGDLCLLAPPVVPRPSCPARPPGRPDGCSAAPPLPRADGPSRCASPSDRPRSPRRRRPHGGRRGGGEGDGAGEHR